jgi:hypothetical protein
MNEKEDILKEPTISNPFAVPSSKESKGKDREPRRVRTFIQPRTPVKEPEPPPDAPKIYQPKFYVSQASLRYVTISIEKNEITPEEVPTIYKLALIISNIFKRSTPTYSDIETAIKFRNIDNAREVMKGNVEVDIIRHEVNKMEVMPKRERLAFWRAVAERIVDEWDKVEETA